MDKFDELKSIYEEIVEYCKENVKGVNSNCFAEPATEEEIKAWEEATNIEMPETYKTWLKLTGYCRIKAHLAEFYFPEVEQPWYVPEGYVYIGDIIGDGEIVCFSKNTKKIITYFEGEVNEEYEDFVAVMLEVKRMLMAESPSSYLTEASKQALLKKLEELKGKL